MKEYNSALSRLIESIEPVEFFAGIGVTSESPRERIELGSRLLTRASIAAVRIYPTKPWPQGNLSAGQKSYMVSQYVHHVKALRDKFTRRALIIMQRGGMV